MNLENLKIEKVDYENKQVLKNIYQLYLHDLSVYNGGDYYISEFFILKKYRRNGVVKKAAEILFHMFPGKYLLGQIPTNNPAIKFRKSIYLQLKLNLKESHEDFQEGKMLFQRFEVTNEEVNA